MGTELKDLVPAAHVAEIVYHGEKLILPQGMGITAAVKLLQDREKYLSTAVTISAKFDAFPWDGAYALQQVLTKRFGWAQGVPIMTFFGERPPEIKTIPIGHEKFAEVPWGRMSITGVEGFLQTGYEWSNNRVVFALGASVLRKDEATVRQIFEDVRAYLKTDSIYRGKAIKMRFLDDDGDDLDMPEPSFLETGKLRPEHLIFSDDIQSAIDTNLFTPISRVQDLIDNGIQIKRGVLLGGAFGTGKTLAATVAATLAVEAGITYVYVPRADELAKAIEFAKQYQSPACVVFCEDVDRVMDGERDVEMDDILNIIDGIDTKSSNIITVLTTNELEKINPAMLRPGRLDAVIQVTAPDQKAAERLLRLYGGGNIAENADLSSASAVLAGSIPATIAEVVKRAKLSQLKLQKPGEKVKFLSDQALVDAAKTMTAQLDLLKRASAPREEPETVDSALGRVIGAALADASVASSDSQALLRRVAERIGA